MNLTVPIAMFGWLPVVLLLFWLLPARRAVTVSFLLAWLFLPIASFKLAEGIPLYDRMSATCVAALAGALLFDSSRVLGYRFSLMDLPMLAWCLCGIPSSLSNNLGLYDGLATVFRSVVTWGLPYFIGRIYFGDREGLKELAIAMVIGGLLYVPLCLFEVRMSPQLHYWVYGYYQHEFAQTKRWGGFRPMVFMEHGLMVGMWMCMTTLTAMWLAYSRVFKRFWILPGWACAAGLLSCAILCKSTGALVLLLFGAAALWGSYLLGIRALVWLLVLIAPTYFIARGVGAHEGADIRDAATTVCLAAVWLVVLLVPAYLFVLGTHRWHGAAIVKMVNALLGKAILWLLVLAVVLFLANRAVGVCRSDVLAGLTTASLGAERGGSLAYRLRNEDALAAKAMQRPIFGWGGWDRSRVLDEEGKDTSVTDGLWIIILGQNGIVGYAALCLAILLPAATLLLRIGTARWTSPEVAPVIVLAMVIVLYWIDCVPNGMVNPIFTLAVGGLAAPQLRRSMLGGGELQQRAATAPPVLRRSIRREPELASRRGLQVAIVAGVGRGGAR